MVVSLPMIPVTLLWNFLFIRFIVRLESYNKKLWI